MKIPEDLKKEIMATFRAELEEHLGTLNKGLLALEKRPSGEERDQLLEDLFRTAHNLKGSARAVGLRDIVTISNRLEDILGALQRGELSPTPELLDAMFPVVDGLQTAMAAHLKGNKLPAEERDQLLDKLKDAIEGRSEKPKGGEEEKRGSDEEPHLKGLEDTKGPETRKALEPAEPLEEEATETQPTPKIQQSSIPQSEDTIRVTTGKLDTLMDGMGELLVARMSNEQRLKEMQTIEQTLSRWQKTWRQVRVNYNFLLRQDGHEPNTAALLDFLAANEENLKSLNGKISNLSTSFSGDYNRLNLLTDNLQDGVRRVRMLPISTLFDLFPRMVRDLARERGKEITLEIEGADSEVDRRTLEAMKDPLTHLLRNAVDHGIESPVTREKAGKPRQGTIFLRAVQKGSTIVLEVADDGSGIDLKRVRGSAVEQGFLTGQEAAGLSDGEATELIFRSGLSTQTQVTDLSGRGVGLDVVRQNLEELHGLIHVNTTPGRGTTFILTLPLTLATSQVLLVETAGETMAIPTTNVERILRVEMSNVGRIEGKPAIRANGRALPLILLAESLGMESPNTTGTSDEMIPVVILGVAEKRVAFQVEALGDTQEVVIKSMGRQLIRVPKVAGATILGGGEVVMILNVADLLKSSQTGRAAVARSTEEVREITRRRVLVVDDSITTRTLEKNILENAGYQVLVAANGEEGWELVQSEPIDAVVADIHMPRMDGFVFTEKVKGEEQFKDLPVVLVTSLDSRHDKIRGLEAGADAYITKQTFDQKELLETLERLIG
ncbi:MAG: hybrid sensor histidine kinase/response regulator [Desulfobacteraceae bacterium]|uniref:histidine kinase n=1 Tax=Candidatus Desulfacyla euxinica TaxID=2841693 RepID=A0A8J6T8H9_9DELT|nr:hybrid sensor histidine kinase/response regulator [Candidatus Desulfacyla euxinica]MBL6977615.1 hybrid sensor histidine kinase/response regulator [Desulfobacteraceae bacterium]MBL7216202.1 hybrid sensor histidine kinase/response regulator [Desulfobacteraceae bacterium]